MRKGEGSSASTRPRVYEILVARCGLAPGSCVLEIGPGTGQASRELVRLGADPLVALRVTTLEDAELPTGHFDLAVAASSFHWVEENAGPHEAV